MYRCDLCNTTMLQRNKNKHNQSKTHKYYSNKILNQYVINNVEVNKYNDVFNPYFSTHSRKFNSFEIFISSIFEYGYIDPCNHKIRVSN